MTPHRLANCWSYWGGTACSIKGNDGSSVVAAGKSSEGLSASRYVSDDNGA